MSFEQRLAVRYLRESGLSYREIGKQVDCHHSTAVKIYKKFGFTGSVANKERTGRPNKFSNREETVICRAARGLRFSGLKIVISDIRISHIYQHATASVVRRILHKYKLYSFQRKRKPYVSVKHRAYRRQWAKAISEWPAEYWNDVMFSDECRFGLKNDSRMFRVWRTPMEASKPELFQPKSRNARNLSCAGGVLGLMVLESSICTQK